MVVGGRVEVTGAVLLQRLAASLALVRGKLTAEARRRRDAKKRIGHGWGTDSHDQSRGAGPAGVFFSPPGHFIQFPLIDNQQNCAGVDIGVGNMLTTWWLASKDSGEAFWGR